MPTILGYAREVFDGFPVEDQAGHCHLMLISADPQRRAGEAPWGMSYVHIFRSPHFIAETVRPSGIVSIGSGSQYPVCRAAVEQIIAENDDTANLTLTESGVPGNIATVLGFRLTEILQQAQPAGISAHLNYCWTYPGRVIIGSNDYSRFGPQWTMMSAGSGIVGNKEQQPPQTAFPAGGSPFTMPALARSWLELEKRLKDRGIGARRCTA